MSATLAGVWQSWRERIAPADKPSRAKAPKTASERGKRAVA